MYNTHYCSLVLLWIHFFLSSAFYVKMTIDTIFMCFCEDCDHNDGIEKPYFMSTGLMVSENFHNLKLSYYRNLNYLSQ